jgi:hypothetical protein
MPSTGVNPVAVAVAGIAYWLVQAGWYITLSNQWQAGTGKTWAELGGQNVAVSYGISLLCDLAVAYGVAWVTGLTGERTAARGVQTGIYAWVFFVATQLATNYAFENRTVAFFAINAGSALVGMIVIGAIVGAWRTATVSAP